MDKYFLYIRKSTDEDDKQVLSLEAQKIELEEFALKEGLDIVESFSESQTAKCPGRPVFNAMLDRLESGEASGVIAWHPDRLARNSVDGGKVIFLVDSCVIRNLKFPTFWFDTTPQGKFMLNIAFGQSKYYVDNLSENVKRGLRQKLRRGEMPGVASLGYLNDLRTHTIVPDVERFALVKKIFVLYGTGNYSLQDLRKFSISVGLFSRGGKIPSVSTIQKILENPFYYGVFKYNGELHEGCHKKMIAKKLFAKCQEVMHDRSRPQKRRDIPHVFRGLLKCGECGCSITSEKQKGHIYYRCTKKKGVCSEKYVREEKMALDISSILQKASLEPDWADFMISELKKDKAISDQSGSTFLQNLKSEVLALNARMEKLLDAHLDCVIERDEYVAKKQKILNEKIEIQEKIKDFGEKGNHWLERAISFVEEAKQAKITAIAENLSSRRDFLKKIGSNLTLSKQKLGFELKNEWKLLYFRGEVAPTARMRGEFSVNVSEKRFTMLGDRDS
ncbi:MAG: recombinase family protein, partial [Candidatus Omnitrophica bacterium]|nr:recombinase family protein [Candidatus Omnitrophota bacterium]